MSCMTCSDRRSVWTASAALLCLNVSQNVVGVHVMDVRCAVEVVKMVEARTRKRKKKVEMVIVQVV